MHRNAPPALAFALLLALHIATVLAVAQERQSGTLLPHITLSQHTLP